jgi:type III pantothenate kinase
VNALPPSIVAAGVGNTSLQFGSFDLAQIAKDKELPPPRQHHVFPVVDGAPQFQPAQPDHYKHWMVASVNDAATEKLEAWARESLDAESFTVLRNDQFPITADVKEPHRVGADRLATAVAVNRLRDPARPAIFVDGGTALTTNVIDDEGRFLGGAILPGAGTSLAALENATQQLPKVELFPDHHRVAPPVIGRDTVANIRAGVYWGLIGAVRQLVQRTIAELGDEPQLYITGGSGAWLSAELGPSWTYIPHLVLTGVALTAAALDSR